MPDNLLPEAATWPPGIYQIETDDPVVGGPEGISNRQAKELANRTLYLKQELEAGSDALAAHEAGNNHPLATTAAKGMVVLSTVAEAIAGLLSDKAVTPVGLAGAVDAAVTALVGASPPTLDTLNEIAAALGDDPNFATTITTLLAAKAPLASPALTGTPTVPTAAPGTNSTQAASTAFVLTQIAANPSLNAGDGLEELAGLLRVKLDGTTLLRSGTGLKLNLVGTNTWVGTQSGTEAPLVDGVTIAWDLAAAQEASVTLGGNRTLGAPTNIVNGTYYSLFVVQDATGSRLLSYNAAYTGVSGVVLSTAANAIDHLVFRANGGKLRLVSFAKNVGG